MGSLNLHARAVRAQRRRLDARQSELAALSAPTPAERHGRDRLDLELSQYLPIRLVWLGHGRRGDPCPSLGF